MWLTEPNSLWPLDGKSVFAIIATMRTGSNLLERVLDFHEDAFCHGELFNRGFIGFQHEFAAAYGGFERLDMERRDADLEGFFRSMISTPAEPVVGYRIFQNHARDAVAQTIFNPGIRKVILRRSLLEAFVSGKIAQMTDQWLIGDRDQRKPFEKITFQIDDFLRYLARNSLYYNEIYHTLVRTGQTFATVDYGELKSPERIQQVAAFVGSGQKLEAVPELLLKQNVKGLRGSVANYDEMIAEVQKLQIRRFL